MLGNDELKSLEEQGSELGDEGSSPAAYHHNHDENHQPFNEGSEEVEGFMDAKTMEEVLDDIKIDEIVRQKEDSVVIIERDLKSEESSDVSFEGIEIAKESFYENGNTGGTSNDESLTEQTSKDENHNPIESIDPSSPFNMDPVTENVPVEETSSNSVKAAAASVSEVENGHTRSVLMEKSIVPPQGSMDLAMKINQGVADPSTDEKARTSSLEEPNKPKEHIKDSETSGCSENQPLVALAPLMVQKTSWLSCCGLFEFLQGSNR